MLDGREFLAKSVVGGVACAGGGLLGASSALAAKANGRAAETLPDPFWEEGIESSANAIAAHVGRLANH